MSSPSSGRSGDPEGSQFYSFDMFHDGGPPILSTAQDPVEGSWVLWEYFWVIRASKAYKVWDLRLNVACIGFTFRVFEYVLWNVAHVSGVIVSMLQFETGLVEACTARA